MGLIDFVENSLAKCILVMHYGIKSILDERLTGDHPGTGADWATAANFAAAVSMDST